MKVDQIKQGIPSWVELMTTDESAAVAFYSALFGWKDDPQPMPEGGAYHSVTLDGDAIAGIATQSDAEVQQHFPPHWTVYLAVDSADAVTAKVDRAGGSVFAGPFEVMDIGRMAIISDPTGGVVGLWEAKKHQGFGRRSEPNTVSWCELMTDDAQRAAEFYASVLGVSTRTMPMGEGAQPYVILGPEGNEGAGIMQKTPEMGEMPNVWSVYFEVADADATVKRARGLGATVLSEPQDITPGRFAILRDPQGAVFGIIKSNAMPT